MSKQADLIKKNADNIKDMDKRIDMLMESKHTKSSLMTKIIDNAIDGNETVLKFVTPLAEIFATFKKHEKPHLTNPESDNLLKLKDAKIKELEDVLAATKEHPSRGIYCTIHTTKPPLGLMPKKIFLENRKEDIINAISRFIGSTKNIPKEWEEELKQINHWLHDQETGKITCHVCGSPL